MPFTLLISLALLIIAAVWFFSHFYRRHMQGENAPQRSAEVTILDKQVIDIPHPLPGQDDQEFWIYVQKGRLGPKREFQVGIHYYHALNPGDKGVLTYQGQRFLHFALKR
ncbi:DUF2500 domain-containing protein [Vibrio cholerae]|uniref:DUF2500 domain-containing protein n=1 Tax=Vibrio cholerae TaxID=666 RepID=UPI000C998154|nr:DUF2500 domain-containing protein [Vibrio cholerae]EIJ0935639.1 DUF2500 domain-containing protein [Vibrio cholerae]EKF9135091.1 DUF2500 domain-containing protein [Vibrio cholerae]